MAVKIRFTRIGRKKCPMYRIIAIDGREKRDGAALEVLGSYDPRRDVLLQYHSERAQNWIAKGAILTDAVKKVMRKSPASPTT